MLKLALWVAAVLILAATAIILFAYLRFSGDISADVARLVANATPSNRTITAAMIEALPTPAQRYFRRSGVVGQQIPRVIRLKQTGRIRGSAADNWMSFEAEETYSTSPPAFVWRTHFPTQLLPVALGRDEYLEGKGSILMKMLALIPLAEEHGEEMRAAGLMRYLNETMWFPAALLGDNIEISPVNDGVFRARITDRTLSAEADFSIDADGAVTNFQARRFNTSTRSVEAWETPIVGMAAFDSYQLPSGGSAVWKLPAGDLTYIELWVTDVTYEN